jgi:cbb3-type cytochrome oxidase subunit 3
MSLSDIVGNAGLALYAQVALVIFFLVFLGIVVYVFVRRKSSWDHVRRLPLDDNDAIDSKGNQR